MRRYGSPEFLFRRALWKLFFCFVFVICAKVYVENDIFPGGAQPLFKPITSENLKMRPEDEAKWKQRNAGIVDAAVRQGHFTARVLEVLDGDTVEIFVGDERGSGTARVRLLGIDTPETKGGTLRAKKQAEQMRVSDSVLYDMGERSKKHLKDLLYKDNPTGQVFVELSGNDRVDRYGRILGMLRPITETERFRSKPVPGDPQKLGLLNRKMLEDGYAMAYVSSKPSTKGNRPSSLYSQAYCVSLVRKAAQQKRGLWEQVSPPAAMGVTMSER